MAATDANKHDVQGDECLASSRLRIELRRLEFQLSYLSIQGATGSNRLISTRLSVNGSAFVSILAENLRNESARGVGGMKQGRLRLANASTVSDTLDAL